MPDSTATSRASTPLLTLITQESMDGDYQHVAERRAATTSDSETRPRHRIALVVIATFGLLVTVAAVQTSQQSGVSDASRNTLISEIESGRDSVADRQAQIVALREENVAQQTKADAANAAEQEAVSQLNQLRATTGFGAVNGPGVRVTVNDRPDGTELVKDTDLRLLINGLWEAGAEAIAINGQRLTARSAIRNSAVAIHVNVRPLSPPYVVLAIGDNRTLQADLLDTTTGLQFRDLADSLGFPVTMDNEDRLSLPAAPERMSDLRWAHEKTPRHQANEHQQEKETQP